MQRSPSAAGPDEGTARNEVPGGGLLLDRSAPPAALRRLGERLERLRNNDALRATLTEFSKERKRQEQIARLESNRALKSRLEVTPEVRREELLAREKAIAEAMKNVREENDRRFAERIDKTISAINRTETNEHHVYRRLEEAQARAAKIKLEAEWSVLTALSARTSAWVAVLKRVQAVRDDFMTWTAAALAIQKAFKLFKREKMGLRAAAARTIVRYSMRFILNVRIRNKRAAVNVLRVTLGQMRLLRRDARFYMTRLRARVTRLQRFARACIETVRLQILSVLRVWNEHEAAFLRQLFSQMRLKAKRSSVKTARIPQNIRVETIRIHLRSVRRRLAEERVQWRIDAINWQEELKLRTTMRQQRELLATDASAVDTSDLFSSMSSAPIYPVFPSRPTDEEMGQLVKAAYDLTMEAFHADLSAAKKRIAAESEKRAKKPVAAKRV